MADEITSVTPPSVAVEPLSLPGQPATDKGFTTANGTKIRIRVIKTAVEAATTNSTGDPTTAPKTLSLDLTIAKLDDNLNVAKIGDELLIMDRHELPITVEALTNSSYDLQASVMTAIEQQAYIFEAWVAQQQAIADYLATQWGGASAAA
jgi:hypothetical protein